MDRRSAQNLLAPRPLWHLLRKPLSQGLAHAPRDFNPEGLGTGDAIVLAALGMFSESGGGDLVMRPPRPAGS
eukprot:8788150-Pyramimonas_sp.AAC.1